MHGFAGRCLTIFGQPVMLAGDDGIEPPRMESESIALPTELIPYVNTFLPAFGYACLIRGIEEPQAWSTTYYWVFSV